MAFRPLANENALYRARYLSIADRIADRAPGLFNLEDLFSHLEWQGIGNGFEQQHFGRRFARDVKDDQYPGVIRNGENPGGNEARYIKQLPAE